MKKGDDPTMPITNGVVVPASFALLLRTKTKTRVVGSNCW